MYTIISHIPFFFNHILHVYSRGFIRRNMQNAELSCLFLPKLTYEKLPQKVYAYTNTNNQQRKEVQQYEKQGTIF